MFTYLESSFYLALIIYLDVDVFVFATTNTNITCRLWWISRGPGGFSVLREACWNHFQIPPILVPLQLCGAEWCELLKFKYEQRDDHL